jgi:hypothetical protein
MDEKSHVYELTTNSDFLIYSIIDKLYLGDRFMQKQHFIN